jgi:hypothetical protein
VSGLPTLTLPIHKIILPFSKQEVEIRPYIIKEEGSILTMLENKKEVDENVTETYKKIISNCVVTENFDISKLNMHDFFFLIIEIRMKSHGEVIECQSKCDFCEKQSEFDINLEESLKVTNENSTKLTTKISKDLSLEVITPNIDSILELSKIEENNVEYTLRFVSNSISKVIYNEQIYKDFTPEEVRKNILDNLTQKEFITITENIEKLAKLIIEFNFTCNHCGKKNSKVITDVMNFF